MKNGIKALSPAFALTLSVGLLTGCSSNNAVPSGMNVSPAAQGAGSNTVRSMAEIKRGGKVIIGVFSDKDPFGYVDANGKYQSCSVYFAERIVKDLGVESEYVSLEPASHVGYPKTGKVDIAFVNFTVTKDCAKAVDLTLPYMKATLGVVSPEKDLTADVEQLAGKKLVTVKGATAETYSAADHPEINLVKLDQYTEAYNVLLNRHGDALSTDSTEVLAWALQGPDFKAGIESLGDVDTIVPAVRKSNKELLDWLNEKIKMLGKESFFHKGFEETLKPVYGDAAVLENLMAEDGEVKWASTLDK